MSSLEQFVMRLRLLGGAGALANAEQALRRERDARREVDARFGRVQTEEYQVGTPSAS